MSIGAADFAATPALDALDENAAAENLAAVGAPQVDLSQQVGVAPGEAHNLALAGSTPDSATAPVAGTDAATAPAAGGSFQLPEAPALTGNAEADIKALSEHRSLLEKARGDLMNQGSQVEQQRQAKEQEALRKRLELEQAERQRFEQERAERHAAIENAIRERAAAAGDIEGARHGDKYTGSQIAAILGGGVAAAFKNMAAAQTGHVGNAENEALAAINQKLQRDQERRVQRLKMSDDDLLQAKYGFKNATDNHRAALNDIDADQATKHLLIAQEAEQKLKALGAPQALIDKSAIVADQKMKAAQAINNIHDREESRKLQAQHYHAEESIARASLGERHEEGEANRELRRDMANEHKSDRSAAAQEKAQRDEEARGVRDPATGETLGLAPTARQATTLNDKLNGQKAYVDAVKAFRDHVAQHGQMLNPLSDEYKERQQLYADAVARGRKARDLGVSTANLSLEHKAFTGSGAGLERKPSLKALDQMIADQERITGGLVKQLVPPRAGARGHGGPASAAPAPVGGPSKEQIQQAIDAVDDKSAPAAVKQKATEVLKAAGYL